MAAFTATSASATSLLCAKQVTPSLSGVKLVSFSSQRASFPSLSSRQVPRLQVSCAAVAKPETVDKVCEIVRKQLALPTEVVVAGDSKFSALGADSLDTVEIVMGLEEAFDITVEEENAQTIETVQDAANLIEGLIEK